MSTIIAKEENAIIRRQRQPPPPPVSLFPNLEPIRMSLFDQLIEINLKTFIVFLVTKTFKNGCFCPKLLNSKNIFIEILQ